MNKSIIAIAILASSMNVKANTIPIAECSLSLPAAIPCIVVGAVLNELVGKNPFAKNGELAKVIDHVGRGGKRSRYKGGGAIKIQSSSPGSWNFRSLSPTTSKGQNIVYDNFTLKIDRSGQYSINYRFRNTSRHSCAKTALSVLFTDKLGNAINNQPVQLFSQRIHRGKDWPVSETIHSPFIQNNFNALTQEGVRATFITQVRQFRH